MASETVLRNIMDCKKNQSVLDKIKLDSSFETMMTYFGHKVMDRIKLITQRNYWNIIRKFMDDY